MSLLTKTTPIVLCIDVNSKKNFLKILLEIFINKKKFLAKSLGEKRSTGALLVTKLVDLM